MSKRHRLLLAVAALSWYNAGVIWLIQFSCYPLWPYVGRSEFLNYHGVWSHGSWGVLFVPGALAVVGSILMLRLPPAGLPKWTLWAGLGVQVAIQLVTVIWLSPLDRRIAAPTGELDLLAYDKLTLANWVRIVLISAYAALSYWMLTRTFWQRTAITSGQWFLLATSALGLYAVGNVWLVQLVCYRLWAYVGRSEAFGYHIAWWHSTWGVLFVPAGLVFVGAMALPWLRPSGVSRRLVWLGLALQVVIYASTAVWWAPLMARLVTPASGMSLTDYQLLMSTHWIRLALITAYGITAFYMLIKTVPRSQWSTS